MWIWSFPDTFTRGRPLVHDHHTPTVCPAVLGAVGNAGGGFYTLFAYPVWDGPRAIVRGPLMPSADKEYGPGG